MLVRAGMKNRRNGAATVGRKREGQPKENRETPSGKFGQRLEKLLARAGLTPVEFAERIDVTPDTVRKWLRGDNSPPLNDWKPIARILGVKDARELLPNIPVD